MENKSKVYIDGSIWNTKNFGDIEIVGMSPRTSLKRGKNYVGRFFYVKFKDGTIVESNISSIKYGEVRNPNKPKGLKDCFIGQGFYASKINGKKTQNYKLWSAMTQRVYGKSYHIKYPTYKDCSLSSDWHNYQIFCEDIRGLDNYTEWVINPKKYHLDKDMLVSNNKHYSKETCHFVLGSKNISYSNKNRKIDEHKSK